MRRLRFDLGVNTTTAWLRDEREEIRPRIERTAQRYCHHALHSDQSQIAATAEASAVPVTVTSPLEIMFEVSVASAGKS
jgi:hypothetical protein